MKSLETKFTIVIDHREKLPFKFENITARIKKQDVPLFVKTKIGTLECGDYSLEGLEDFIAIERKSVEDIVNTIAHHRKRFMAELEKLNDLAFAAVVIEREWQEVLSYCAHLTNFSPRSLDSSILSFNQRFPIVQWYFRPSKWVAAKTTYKSLDLFWRKHNVYSYGKP